MSGPSGEGVLVAGATGTQGGAVTKALRANGHAVRALVRDPGSAAARTLASLGAELVIGSFEDENSMSAALAGAVAVFSVQPPPDAEDKMSERRQGRALIDAARRAGVRHLVHSSVSNAGDFASVPGWKEGRWGRNYWESKAEVEAMVRAAGFPRHTILRPGFFMENFVGPMADFMFPDLRQGQLLTAIEPATRLQLVAADDIGRAAAAAIEEPARFDGVALELAGDLQTPAEIAATLSSIKGVAVEAVTLSGEALIARGQSPRWVKTQEWYNVAGCPARPEMMQRFGLAPTRFADWTRTNTGRLAIAVR